MSIQDLLSGIKTAVTSNTGKAVLGSLAGAAVAGHVGGSAGISALGGVVDRFTADRKNRDLEDIRKAKEKLTAERDALDMKIGEENLARAKAKNVRDIETDREDLLSKKLKNYAEVQKNIVSGAMNPYGVSTLGKVKSGLSRSGSTGDLKLPDTVPAMMTNPALNPNEKSLEAAQNTEVKTGSQHAADFVSRAGLKNLGEKTYKDLRPDFKSTMEVLSKGQQQAGGRAFAEEVAPGFAEKAQAMRDTPTGADKPLPGIAARAFAAITAAIVAGAKGAAVGMAAAGPWGAAAGAALGATGAAGSVMALTGAVMDYFDGQASATNTPAVAGADRTAAEDISYGENSSISPEARMIVKQLKEEVATPQGLNAILSQLDGLSDFADLTPEERQGIKRVLFQKFSEREQQPQNVSGDMARMSSMGMPEPLASSAYRPMSR